MPYIAHMPHTYCSNLVHCVFSTKERARSIKPEIQPKLWAYMGGIARSHGFRALAVVGTEDHAHVLVSLPPVIAVAKAVQLLKGSSSKRLHDTHPDMRVFAWQQAYGAFSVSISHVDDAIAYILNQPAHHKE